MKAPRSQVAYVAAMMALATYAFVTLHGARGIPALLDKRHQIQEMEKRNAAVAQDIERLKEHIQRLEDNPAEQELEIRDRLKLVRPGDKVFITGVPESQ